MTIGKLLEGTQGMGVILAESVKSAESVLDAMNTLRQNIGTDSGAPRSRKPAR